VFPFLQAAGGGLPRRRLPPHAAGAAGSGLPRRRLSPHARARACLRVPPIARATRALNAAALPARDPAREREREKERD